jgi:hypothetical protein
MSAYEAKTVVRQFANSPVTLALLAYMDQWIDPEAFKQEFYDYVWNINTAQGFGLDIWGRIIGLSRNLQVVQTPGDNFGFSTDGESSSGQAWQPWSQAPFFTTNGTVTFPLQDSYYRQLLLVKAAANISRCDCQSINALMRSLFGSRGKCYVGYDINNPMFIGYHFEFFPTAVETAIIESGFFPQPAGTDVTYIFNTTLPYSPFGFETQNRGANPDFVTGWNQGPFYAPGAINGAMLDNIGNTFTLNKSKLG